MRGRMRNAAKLAALLCVVGCGGSGDGGTPQVMLEGDEAVQAVTSVVRSTVAALIGLRSEPGLYTSQESSCVGGGIAASCKVENRHSIVRGSLDQCRIPVQGGNIVIGDGRLRIETSDQGTCITGRIADTAAVEIRADDFVQVVTDADGNELSRSRTSGTDRIVPVGVGCAGRNLAESLDVTTDVINNVASPGRLVADGVDARIDLSELQLDQESTGVPCARVLTADGTMDVDDRANGIRYSQTLSGVTIRFIEEAPDTLVEINGDIGNGCLGSLTLATVAPLRLRNAVDCPTGGTLRVTAAGRTSEIQYGPQGQLSIDYNGDGVFELARVTCEALMECTR